MSTRQSISIFIMISLLYLCSCNCSNENNNNKTKNNLNNLTTDIVSKPTSDDITNNPIYISSENNNETRIEGSMSDTLSYDFDNEEIQINMNTKNPVTVSFKLKLKYSFNDKPFGKELQKNKQKLIDIISEIFIKESIDNIRKIETNENSDIKKNILQSINSLFEQKNQIIDIEINDFEISSEINN